jgi:hypothetical protein
MSQRWFCKVGMAVQGKCALFVLGFRTEPNRA